MPKPATIKRSLASLTPEEAADLATRYPHEPNISLAAEFALSVGQVANFARTRSLRKTPEAIRAHCRKPDALTADIERCVLDAGPDGIDSHSLTQAVRALCTSAEGGRAYVTTYQVCMARLKLVQQQRIHPLRPGSTERGQCWFGTAAWASAAAAKTQAASPKTDTGTPRETRAANFATIHDRRRHRQADEADARRRHVDTPTNNPNGVVPQVLPGAPESRWAGLKVTDPTFSSRRPGEYLDHEPPAWVRAACREPLPKLA